LTNIVKEPLVQAREPASNQRSEAFSSAFVVDISHVQGGIYVPSNGRIPRHVPEREPLNGAHRYATVVREMGTGA